MKTIERTGKSTSAVISGFMKEFNLQLEDFKFEVVDEGKKSLFGLLTSKPTVIKFIMSDISDSISSYTKGILNQMSIDFEKVRVEEKDNTFYVEIEGVKEAGFLIGKEARILDAIQHLVNQMINKQERKSMHLEMDIDGYRERKNQQLVDKMKVVAERVKKTGRSYTFEPMNATRRKIIHQFVEKDTKLQTMTIGRGESKRVIISQAGKKLNQNDTYRNTTRRPPRPHNIKKA
ncbi:MAG: KH domain-containing protein [Candidatus Cloacimonetes bacterium]|nr:KH domain-containing protein [Candidatus Cloacimonadota bacterium]